MNQHNGPLLSVDAFVRDVKVLRHEDVALGLVDEELWLDLVGFWYPDLLEAVVGHHLGLDDVNNRFRQLFILNLFDWNPLDGFRVFFFDL